MFKHFALVGLLALSTACSRTIPPTDGAIGAAPTSQISQVRADNPIVVKAHEIQIQGTNLATYSIIVGPDHNLWFTTSRSIVRMTPTGRFSTKTLVSGDSDPGMLTVGPDGNIWANTAALWPPRATPAARRQSYTAYEMYRLTPNLKLTIFALPNGVNSYPSNLVVINNQMYFGVSQLVEIRGGDQYRSYLATISTRGTVKFLTRLNRSWRQLLIWLGTAASEGPLVWLYDYKGGLFACTLHGTYKYAYSAYPYGLVDNLHPTEIVYSPTAHYIYISNHNTYSIYKFSLRNRKVSKYTNLDIAMGSAAIAYYRRNVVVALGPDSKGRPMFGRLSPEGKFTEFSLPYVNQDYVITAFVGGPDGHLWYLRGNYVGEVLSKI